MNFKKQLYTLYKQIKNQSIWLKLLVLLLLIYVVNYAVNKYETCPTRREEISTEYSGNPAGKNKNKSYQDAYQMEVRNSKIQTQNNKHINLGLQPKIQFVKGTNTRKNRKDNTNQRKPLPAFIQRRN